MFSQGVIPSSPGLCPTEGQKPGLYSWTRARSQFLSLSLGTDKTPLHYHMLVIYPALYLSHYILPTDPQVRLRSNKLMKSTISCGFVGNFISSYPQSMPGGNVIQRHLALLYQWRRCFSNRKGFQNRLTVGASTYFSNLAFIWISWTQAKVTYIPAWKTVAYIPREMLSLLPKDCR
jgi:hypothetical protein